MTLKSTGIYIGMEHCSRYLNVACTAEACTNALKIEENTLFVKKEYHETISTYTNAIDTAPNAILHANRAQCYLGLGM
jgi:hypothetical protein